MRYATINNWAQYFQENEEIQISPNSIRNKLQEAEKIGITGRNEVGRVLKNAFYSEADVREVCANLLQPLPQADNDNFFELSGERYAPYYVWARVLSIGSSSIRKRLNKTKKQSVKGKGKDGGIYNFYSESDILEVCADILDENLPQADKDGFFDIKGTKYGFPNAWSRILLISIQSISRRLSKAKTKVIKGKNKKGRICDFYSESDVLSACEDLLQDLPQANEDGFFEKDDVKYGTLRAWSRILLISIQSIRRRLSKAKTKGIKGKDKGGRVQDFYPESDVREVCVDTLENLPHADKNGFFEKEGQKYGTISVWSRTLLISGTAISLSFT